MINISFFGASVTAQKMGYVNYFCDEINKNHTEFNVNKHGYGSMHIKDAGMCFIDDVLASNPNYCFIDWFSTFYTATDTELISYLDNFRFKFISNNCQIVFLLFGGSEYHMHSDRLLMYNEVIQYANKYKIPYINLYEKVKNYKAIDLYKDMVHTLDYASSLYGKEIYQQFITTILNKKINQTNLINNQFATIKKLQIKQTVIEEFIKIKGNGKVLGIHQTAGPYSGIVEIDSDGCISKQNIWDSWCYYERKVLKIQKKFKTYLNVFISQEDFDRSKAKHQVDWNMQKLLKPIDNLYYIGDIKEVEIK